jgi:putative membrane protein
MGTMINTVKLMLKGGVIGIANIIPGVSGGTMAVVLGIYEKLIEAIGNILIDKKRRKEYFFFLLKVFLGAGICIVIFSWIMDYLLTNYEQYTYLFFIGLILGSIPSIYQTHPNMKLSVPAVITFLAGITVIMLIFLFAPEQQESIPTAGRVSLSSYQVIMLIISGFFSGGSMIMPGVSGSFILVILGQYHIVIRAVKNFDILPLMLLGIGIALGVWSFAKIIDFLLKKFPRETFYFILGLVVASVIPIYPGMPEAISGLIIATVILVVAALISYKLGDR